MAVKGPSGGSWSTWEETGLRSEHEDTTSHRAVIHFFLGLMFASGRQALGTLPAAGVWQGAGQTASTLRALTSPRERLTAPGAAGSQGGWVP